MVSRTVKKTRAKRTPKRAWVVAVSMGFGHQRTAYPLRHLAPDERILNANDYPAMPASDRAAWDSSRKFYEFMSNFQSLPVVGRAAWRVFDEFQKIADFYPKKASPTPTLALRQSYALIRRGWGAHFIQKLAEEPRPLVSTFFTPAFMADYYQYPGKIYCIVCDTDISRTWAPLDPASSRITYLAPTDRAAERLRRYGVPTERVILTGYPLPKENLGTPRYEIARRDTAARIMNLDPAGAHRAQMSGEINQHLGRLPKASDRPLTLLFSIGGAGAQRDLAHTILESLAPSIRAGFIRFWIAAGTKAPTRNELQRAAMELNIHENFGLIFANEPMEYFANFNRALRETDILWTKPSELSFYAGLGIPVIIAPPLGSHEFLNRAWLEQLGAGLPQEDPRYTHEWLFDFVKTGWFADAALQGFVKIEKGGTFAIERLALRS
ncbi:MAG TPA: hypothetical protein VMC43_00255 [Candidatus Paceibacterota bacterium]|nr:hypothetical protein [Candidatus Paceibacterota bacterium]